MKDCSFGSQYKCSQLFGYKGSKEKIHEEDLISVIKFDKDGQLLALGDKAGRIIVFKQTSSKKRDDTLRYYAEFQAYSRQFDSLNSVDIDEEVTGMVWLRSQGNYKKMLTTNARSLKMWKIFEKPQRRMIKTCGRDTVLPKFQIIQNSIEAALQKKFPSKHEEPLTGVDSTNNQQYILVTDPLKTLLWDIQKTENPFIVADLQGKKQIEQVEENINCMRAHPTSDSLFAYGTNRGLLVLSDMRTSNSSKSVKFSSCNGRNKNNFFTQMISSYSSLTFINDGQSIAARDYLSAKVWDLKKTDQPIINVMIQESLKSKLCDIFENDCIFDKFSLSASKDSNTLLTGNYNNTFHTIDINDVSNTQFQFNYKKQTVFRPILQKRNSNINKMDYIRKTVASDFNPKTNMFAVASLNCFATYVI